MYRYYNNIYIMPNPQCSIIKYNPFQAADWSEIVMSDLRQAKQPSGQKGRMGAINFPRLPRFCTALCTYSYLICTLIDR